MKSIELRIILFATFYFFIQNTFSQSGSLDPDFNSGVGLNGPVFSIALQSNCKILTAGGFNSYNGSEKHRLFRINSNGTLDNTFSFSAIASAFSVATQSNGKILVGGDGYFFRTNEDGSQDNGFIFSDVKSQIFPYEQFGRVQSIAIQPDNKILIGGSFSYLNENFTPHCIVRLNLDGSIDQSFNSIGSNYYITTIVIQNDGKILVGGDFTIFNDTPCYYITRINNDGSIDNSFNAGNIFNGVINTIVVQSDGKVLVGGGFSFELGANNYNHIARLNTDGSIDTTFNTGFGFNDNVNIILPLNENEILIGGKFQEFNGISQVGISFLKISETSIAIDTTFDTGDGFSFVGSASEIGVNVLLLQPINNRIIVGGHFNRFNGFEKNGIVRLLTENNETISESCIDNTIILYPNPTLSEITIESTKFGTNTSVNIFNTIGELVFQIPILYAKTKIDLGWLNSSIYYLQLIENDGTLHLQKFIVSK